MTDESKHAPQLALLTSRQRVEESLDALRQAVHDSTGGRLGRPWTLPLLAAAVGFSVALLLRRGRR